MTNIFSKTVASSAAFACFACRTTIRTHRSALNVTDQYRWSMIAIMPFYVRVTFEDGHYAWSSPIYLFR